jgi:hypothetical protein
VILTLFAALQARADVSFTPGTIQGTVSLTSDIPASLVSKLVIDAVNPPSEGTQYLSTKILNVATDPPVQNGQTLTWTYSITVEAALTHHYYVRPILYLGDGSPPVNEQIAMPEFEVPDPVCPLTQVNGDPVCPAPSAGVSFNINYTPAVLQGTFALDDPSSVLLPGESFSLIAHDDDPNSSIVPDPACGPSIGGNCLSNSRVDTTNSTYEIYLKPGRAYSLQQYLSWSESATASQAGGTYQYDFDTPYPAVGAGATDTRNYTFSEKAAVTGSLSFLDPTSLPIPLKNVTASITGTTMPTVPPPYQQTLAAGYNDYYLYGAASSPFVMRIFDNADFSQPFSLLLDATFMDGGFVQAPRQLIDLSTDRFPPA